MKLSGLKPGELHSVKLIFGNTLPSPHRGEGEGEKVEEHLPLILSFSPKGRRDCISRTNFTMYYYPRHGGRDGEE
jgi:hypothetical protein